MAFLMERLRPAVARQWALGARADAPALRSGLLGGAAAAGLGLALVAVPMLLLWIVTPYAADGPGGVVHLAACFWLLAHGAGLLRPASYGAVGYGGPGVPLAVTPLLVSVLVLLPLYRAGARIGSPGTRADDGEADEDSALGDDPDDSDDPDAVDAPPNPWSVLLGLATGYLLVASAVVVTASTGSLRVASAPAAFGWTALLALPVAALGVRRGAGPDAAWGAVAPRRWFRRPSWRWSGRWSGPGERLRPEWLRSAWLRAEPLRSWWPERLRLPVGWAARWSAWCSGLSPRSLPIALRPAGGAAVAVRAALAGGAALLGTGGLVLLAALLTHLGAAGTTAAQTAPDLAGRLALLLLCAAVLPNAAVWGAAYATGPGFLLGGWLGPLGGTAPNALAVPAFPLFAALPGPGRSLPGLLTLVLPLAAGAVVAAIVARAAAPAADPSADDLGPDDLSPDDLTANGLTADDPAWDGPGDRRPARWGPTATAGVALTAALGTGLLAALCAEASGGSLGLAVLARVGPSPWRTGLAALAWTAAVGVPGAVLLRWVFSRSASGATPGARASRWCRTGCRTPW